MPSETKPKNASDTASLSLASGTTTLLACQWNTECRTSKWNPRNAAKAQAETQEGRSEPMGANLGLGLGRRG